LKNFDNGGSMTVGAFVLTQLQQSVPGVSTTVKLDTIGGAFSKYTGFQLAAAATSSSQITTSTSGACTVVSITGTSTDVSPVTGKPIPLDAGGITLNGPSGSNITNMALKQDASTLAYSLQLATEGLSIPGSGGSNVTLAPGTYTLAGAGGKDVGKFNASVTIGTPLTVTGGLPTTISRSQGLTLNWTGGNATDIVEVVGYSGSFTGTGANATLTATEFYCITTAGAKTLTVPPSILTQLPAVPANSATQPGFLEVVSTPNPTSGNGLFTAPLTAGGNIDMGLFFALVGLGATVSYQ
jgi:hypothetical protein